MKKIVSVAIVLCMILALCPLSAFAVTAPTGVSANAARRTENTKAAPSLSRAASVLTFSSDVHNKSGNESANRLSGWLDNVINMYGKIDVMGFCGDMGDASANESNFWTYTQSVMDVVSNHSIPAVYTTGNHEHYNGNYSSTTNSVASNYIVDQEGVNGSNFRIYALGTDNWSGSSDNYTEAQVNTLRNYLNSVDNSKPIIILTHFPLHTTSGGSSWWGGRTTVNADLVIDALNEASAAGKTIVLLWGHNHTMSDVLYDEIFQPGYTITYASNSTKTIQFYYAAAGCMSDSEYGSGSAFVKGKGLVITVDGGALDFHYYDANGNDVTENGSGTDPVTPGPTITPTPVPGATLPEDGKTYVIISSDGYALTSEGDTVGYTNGSEGSQQYVYTGLVGKAYSVGETVSSDLLWTFNTSGSGYTIKSQDGRYLNGTYVSNSSGGYDSTLKLDNVTDVWTISGSLLRSTNGSQSDSGDKFLSHGNGTQSDYNMFAIRSQDNATTFVIYEYNTDGEYIGSEEPTVTTAPTGGTTEIRYVETSTLEAGKDYILAVGTGSSVNAITAGSNNASSTALTVTDNYIKTDLTNVVWTRTSSAYFQNGSNYLYPTSGNGIMVYSSGRAINYVNGHLAYETSSSGTYYITYNNGFSATNNESSASTFRLFVKTEVVIGGETEDPVTEAPITEDPVTPAPTTGTVTQVSGFENGKTYVIVADDGYALTCNDTDASFSNAGGGTQSYVYTGLAGVVFDQNSITADMLWTAQSSGSGWNLIDQSGRYLNGIYESNGNGYNGDLNVDSTADVWTISGSNLKSTNASSGASSDKFLTHGSGSSSNSVNVFTVRSSSSASTITIYEYNGDPGDTPTVPPTTAPTGGTTEIRYVESSTLEAGNDYILAVGTGSSVNAITAGSNNASSTALTVTDNYIKTDLTNVVWTRTSNAYFQNGSNYLYPTSGNGIMVYSSGRAINYVNGHLSYETSSSGTYYITYNNGFSATNDESAASTFRLFVKTEVVIGGETDAPVTETPITEDPVTPAPTTGTVTQVSGFENGKTYVIVADDGYALTCNDTDASFSNAGGGTQSYVYTGLAGVVFDQNSITTDMLWTAQSSGSGWNLLDQSGRYLSATYESNGNGYTGNVAVGSVTDVWTVSSSKLRSANASSGSSSDKFLVHSNGSTTIVNVFSVRSNSSASTITIYEYTGSNTPTDVPVTEAPTETPVTPTPTPTTGSDYIFVETDHVEADKEYIIAVNNGTDTVAAISAGSGNNAASVTLNVLAGSNYNYIETEDTSVVWTRTSSDTFMNGDRYLYPTSGNGVLVYSSGRALSYENGHIFFTTSSSGTYYLTYSSSGFGTSSSASAAADIRLFVKTDVGEDPSYLLGDVNFSGTVDASDAIMIMRYNLKMIELSDLQLLAGDVNGSGSVDASDAILIMRKVLGLVSW